LVTKGVPCTGIDKNVMFRAKAEIELSRIIAFSTDDQFRITELKHCGRPDAVKRKSHGDLKTLTATVPKARHKHRDKNLFNVKFLCIGTHDRKASPLVVFIQAVSSTGEILRSKPFILCPSREAMALQATYQKMKPALEAATEALANIPALSTGPGPDNQNIHPEPNPPHPAHSSDQNDDELDALPQGGPLEYNLNTPWEDSFSDFSCSRFAN